MPRACVDGSDLSRVAGPTHPPYGKYMPKKAADVCYVYLDNEALSGAISALLHLKGTQPQIWRDFPEWQKALAALSAKPRRGRQ
jgi:hypothetical protein